MTLSEAEQFLRTCGVVPTQTLIELVKSVWTQAYMDGFIDGRFDRD